jgi:PAS domain S-box-containing protein
LSGVDLLDEHFRLLVDLVEEYAIYLLDLDGTVRTWNPGARRLKGYDRDEIVGRHFSTFFGEEDRARGKPATLLALALAEGPSEIDRWATTRVLGTRALSFSRGSRRKRRARP